ncbi:hypothetical protein ACOMHN_013643 [Nucella lapillus]
MWLTLRHSTAVLFLVAVYSDLSSSTCPPANPNDGTMSTYVPINETDYDRTYARIDSGKHPLGFYSATWHYNQPNVPNPCIKITAPGARNSMLEIKFETVPSAMLCVKDQGARHTCYQGSISLCGETPGDTVYVEFLCDSQCEEADVNFWYRLVLSPPNEVDWCLRRPNDFPSKLAVLPPGATLPTFTTPSPRGTGTAAHGASSSVSLLAAAVLSVGVCVVGASL